MNLTDVKRIEELTKLDLYYPYSNNHYCAYNIITTHDDLYKSLVADKKFENLATKEVLNYKVFNRCGSWYAQNCGKLSG